jgi:hypothetical protein
MSLPGAKLFYWERTSPVEDDLARDVPGRGDDLARDKLPVRLVADGVGVAPARRHALRVIVAAPGLVAGEDGAGPEHATDGERGHQDLVRPARLHIEDHPVVAAPPPGPIGGWRA